jgi:E3 ubiquitin-protein ligase HUWE1
LLHRYLFFVKFKGEEGVDAGGLRRDWFDTLGRKLVEEAEAGKGRLMVLEDKTLFPRPYEERSMDLLAIGRLAALAVFHGDPLPIPLGSVACKLLLGESINPKDVQRLDPDFYQFRLKPVLAPGGIEILEAALCEPLMFMSAPTALRESKELCPGGAGKRVTEENKEEYISLLCEYYLFGDREEQIKIFLRGFWDIFPKEHLLSSGVTYRELALLIAGHSEIDPFQWKAHTQDNVGESYAELIGWFWQMVEEMSQEDRAKLLHFATGSSRLPSNGFAGLEPGFNITVELGEQDHLPQSHTCGNQLVLPAYSSKEMLVEKMRISIANDEGFGFA